MTNDRYRILITGSRTWPDVAAIFNAIKKEIEDNPCPAGYTVVHGDAPGADSMAAWAAEDLQSDFDITIEAHPADWDKYKFAAGPVRNQEMVNLGAHVCLAFNRHNSTGTLNCIQKAKEAGIPVTEYQILKGNG